MLNNFTNTLDKIAKKVKDENQKNKTEEFHLVLDNAVSFWCQELDFDYEKINYICQGYKQQNIENFISYLWEESKTQKKPSERWILFPNTIDNPLSQKINSLLSRINPNFRTTSTEFIVLIAFVTTAVGYCVYLINHSPKQQQLTQKTNNTSNELINSNHKYELATAYRFTTEPFQQYITPERVARITQISPGDTHLKVDQIRRQKNEAEVELKMSYAPEKYNQTWLNQQIAIAEYLDTLSELSARLDSLQEFAALCESQGVKSSKEILPNNIESGLYILSA